MEPNDWPQVLIQADDRSDAERVSVERLRPALAAAEAVGVIGRWWFLRKSPEWRLRYQPAGHHAERFVGDLMERLAAEGRIVRWSPAIYEPERFAFGGDAGTEVAHDLFHSHSRETLDHLARRRASGADVPRIGRRELAILLPSVLMRAAGLDRFEQGDVWGRVAGERPADRPRPLADAVASRVARLMTVDVGPGSSLVADGPLAALAGWVAAFERAGWRLAGLARSGTLERGLRAVISHQVIFVWNVLGLVPEEQSTLSTLAKEVVMGTGNSTGAAERLRNGLADALKDQGVLRSEWAEDAVRSVPRDVFVRQFKPAASLEEAYADTAVHTKLDGSGVSISAVSQPTINAVMLELVDAQPGMRVKEAGAGSGLFAAYLGRLVGEEGHVYTFDVDEDLVDGARAALAAAGAGNVTVVLGDGAVAHPEAGGPFDRVVATVGAYGIPPAWLDELAPGGRLVAPLRLRGSVCRAIAFERGAGGRWRSVRSEMSTFMPLRGVAEDVRRIVPLAPDGSVTLQSNEDQVVDADALAGVLRQPRVEAWSGVTFRGPESQEYMDLYLACAMDNGLSRITMDDAAVGSGLVLPRFGGASMAVTEKGNLAYLTIRKAGTAADGGQLYEVGVVGHGPGGDELACRLIEAARTWDREFRGRSVGFEIRPLDDVPPVPRPGYFVLDTPLNRLAVEWR